MTESFVTQCPHCQTRFRVTRAQLGMARGAVRCGACLQVFNAAEQLATTPLAQAAEPEAPGDEQDTTLTAAAAGALAAGLSDSSAANIQLAGYTPAPPMPTSADAATPPAASPTAPTAPAAAAPAAKAADDDTLWIHDDLDLDNLDLELDEELAKLEPDSFELSSEFLDYHPPQSPFGSAASNSRDPHDESWAEALLHDQSPGTPRGAKPLDARHREEPPLAEDNPCDELGGLADDAQEVAAHPQAALVAERDQPLSVSEAAATLAASAAAQRSEPQLRAEGLRHLNDEPLQLDWQAPRANWGRRLLWLLLILLALAGLAGQYIWHHLPELARQEQWRPWFEKACPLLGCSLPPRVDVSLIKSSNLTVRSHPTHPGALTVDAIIYNRGDFAQPFPLLELRFEDINGQPLASRRFKPGEYLSGELAGRTSMPPQTPIHIALEILDPGAQAVNYSLAFHSPD
ncbi:DUF3426 domain-containing protein [Pseudomonas sp. MAP12]|uniref:DUF3426 domain-containing protein n=1 Tax=Geopseudomonas aromaticivorans TaxID=2849492 RepID=A0ABS6N1D2_9GAMM|nr:DUF3426 domain-containing protein [Pseudomonas aromaticivorans]MBV2134851.1 DUF3426 domain-containing protein [Pseudomonas aromaticivorans]